MFIADNVTLGYRWYENGQVLCFVTLPEHYWPKQIRPHAVVVFQTEDDVSRYMIVGWNTDAHRIFLVPITWQEN